MTIKEAIELLSQFKEDQILTFENNCDEDCDNCECEDCSEVSYCNCKIEILTYNEKEILIDLRKTN